MKRRQGSALLFVIMAGSGLVSAAGGLSSAAHGQSVQSKFEITPFAGLQGGGSFSTRDGSADVPASENFGLLLSYRVRPDGLVEFLFSRQPTLLEVNDFDGRVDYSLDVDYFQFGGLWEIGPNRTKPFLGLTVGATHMTPSDLSDAWGFSAGISGGAKFWLNDHLGLRIEGRGLVTFAFDSASIFCGAGFGGGGCAVSASGDGLFQLSGNAGLIFAF